MKLNQQPLLLKKLSKNSMTQSKKFRKSNLSSTGVKAPVIHELDCGLKVVYKRVYGTHTTNMGYIIGAGSVNDPKGKEGMAHFFEHILFRNTKKKNQLQIINEVERIGGDLNAFTAKEVTVVYANFLSKYYSKILKLLTDVVFNNSINESDVYKEKEIIADEISMYEDSPDELIYDQFNEELFKGSKYGNRILGNKQTLLNISKGSLERFYQKHYRTTNIVLSIVTNLDWNEVKKQFRFLESELEYKKFKTSKIKLDSLQNITFNKTIPKKLSQNYLCIGRKAYNHASSKKVPFMLLNNIIGGPGMNSKLNLELREKKALTYHIESLFTSYKDEGIFCILVGAEARNISKCEKLIDRVLSKFESKALGEKSLLNAKKQFVNQLLMAEESKHSMMVFNGKQVLWYNRVESMDDFLDKVKNVNSQALLRISEEMFGANELSKLKYT
jgi:predicted Zn-dependent peptidase